MSMQLVTIKECKIITPEGKEVIRNVWRKLVNDKFLCYVRYKHKLYKVVWLDSFTFKIHGEPLDWSELVSYTPPKNE